MTRRVRLTYEDYAALPDDGRRYELHEGELSVTPSPGLSHQDILGNLFVILRGHINATGSGRCSSLPSIASSRTSRRSARYRVRRDGATVHHERTGHRGRATLVVEVISPSGIDRRRKRQLYARYAVPYYWIVDPPARTIEAHQLAQDVYRDAGVLSGTAMVPLPRSLA